MKQENVYHYLHNFSSNCNAVTWLVTGNTVDSGSSLKVSDSGAL
jgi:hypothetical protein